MRQMKQQTESCPLTYICTHCSSNKLYETKSNLSMISLNDQSIKAKFDEFQTAINQINNKHEISIICIPESWLFTDSETYCSIS